MWKTLNEKWEHEVIDLEREAERFTWERFHSGKIRNPCVVTYWENHLCHEMGAQGCDYERKGCHLKPGDVVLDIGANIGCFAARAVAKGASRVLCYEAVPEVFDCLQANAAQWTNVEVHNEAVWNYRGRVALYVDKSCPGAGSLVDDNVGQRKSGLATTAPTIDIRELVERHAPIGFLKMDVEGAEVPLLRRLLPDGFNLIDRVSLEYHRACCDWEHDQFTEPIKDMLRSVGYHLYTAERGDLLMMHAWR
jgi:FkbM family methyltransferase